MAIRDTGAIKQMAAARQEATFFNTKKLALIHVGVAVGASLIVSVIDLLLVKQIGTTGGLSGFGMRSVLETARTVLQYVINIGLPFWDFGFLFAAIRMARGEDNRPATLLEGFRRFGPVLRLQLIRGILYFFVGMVCFYAASFLFYMTPLAQPLIELMEPILMGNGTVEQMQAAMEQIPVEQLWQIMWPVFAIAGVLYAVVLIPLHYRLRLANFFIMDAPRTGAIMAMLQSFRFMRRNGTKWFRLELSFWWYYLILGVSSLVIYGDMLLPLAGISLPVSGEVAWILFYVLGLAVQLLLGWQAQSQVQTTYAVAYDILRQQEPYTPPAKPVPQNLPWDNYPTE